MKPARWYPKAWLASAAVLGGSSRPFTTAVASYHRGDLSMMPSSSLLLGRNGSQYQRSPLLLPTGSSKRCLTTTSALLAKKSGGGDDDDDDTDSLQQELEREVQAPSATRGAAKTSLVVPDQVAGGDGKGSGGDDSPAVDVVLERLARPPAKYDVVTATSVYRWTTIAKHGRKVTGPMREWADEFKYRTGVHVDMDVIHPEKANTVGGYASADDVEVNLYFFGADKAIKQAASLLKAMVRQEPSYVRLAVFRRRPEGGVQWLALRRKNRDGRPIDIPAISLKTPGKWTLLFETYKEAAIRTLWEETGIHVEDHQVIPTGRLQNTKSEFFWRVPVHYFIAEVPADVEVLGPQAGTVSYVMGWDPKVWRGDADPINRAWANLGDPKTGCAWLTTAQFDELQLPLRGEKYMSVRYTPSPASGLQEVVGLIDPGTPEFLKSVAESAPSQS